MPINKQLASSAGVATAAVAIQTASEIITDAKRLLSATIAIAAIAHAITKKTSGMLIPILILLKLEMDPINCCFHAHSHENVLCVPRPRKNFFADEFVLKLP